ncbi:oxygenase [Streptomyces mashuensis]|uniref:Oxygenase n=1 Tax=Streptomyces mashuensis TaxID=33904 RepID=A0A919AUT7_9ACTN|nr:FAD-dependent oxidoreductase [Streptomyces mashuensis]GHF26677.1 oxygenase [Streptomyces mashuensis]
MRDRTGEITGDIDETRDVVIVGAGPTGLALAVALRQYGLDVALLEKEPSTKRQVRASVIWQRALEVLRDFGCSDRFLEQGLSLRRSEVYIGGRHAGRQDLAVTGTPFANPLAIEQIAIEGLLADRLRELGTEVQWNTEAVAVRTYADGAEVRVREHGTGRDRERVIGCRWVVGCEGAHSLVRKTLDVPFEGERRTGFQAVQINAMPDWKYTCAPDTTHIFVERRVCLIASPRPGGGYRFFAFRDDPDPGLADPPTVDEMRELVARASHDTGVQLVPTEPPWFNRARFHDRLARSLRVGRALLAGDSAHLWAPVGGRGLNTGLRGVHNLAWKLAAVHQGRAPDELLDTYSAEQRAIVRDVMRQMRRNVVELPPSRAMLLAMRLAVPAVLASERLSRGSSDLLSELPRHHRAGKLSTDAGGRGELRAGDRLPDTTVVADGRPCRVHELLSYERWTLLTDPRADLAALRRAADRHSLPLEVHAVRPGPREGDGLPSGTLYLVRPDGHIGLRARHTAVRTVDAYLRRWSTPRTPR